MSKHTPGPWRVNVASIESGKYKYPEIVRETKPGSIVLDVIATSLAWQWRAREEEHWANANLLAAAPDLLEALVELRNAVAVDLRAVAQMDDNPERAMETLQDIMAAMDKASAAIVKADPAEPDPAAAVHKMRDAEYRRKTD